MIRAVTRYTLEISRPSSPYFERAICFVKPEYAHSDRLDLHRAANQLIATLDAGVGEPAPSDDEPVSASGEESLRPPLVRRVLRLLPLALAAAVGAGAAVLIMLLARI